MAGKYNMIAALEALKPASQHPDYMPQGMKAFAINEGKGALVLRSYLPATLP